MLAVLLATNSVHAVVTCTNENTAINEATPNADFTDNGDGTVTHNTTGLVWMRCSLGQSWNGSTCTGTTVIANWQAALQLAQDINSGVSNADGDNAAGFAGQTDWRLPNRKELASIVEERCWLPSINMTEFPAAPSGWYWSSSPHASGTLTAWIVQFDYGREDVSAKNSSNWIRLVRAGP